MRAELRMPSGVMRRDHAGERWPHDRWIRTAEMRRARAEAIAEGVHWVWTKARRAVERLMNGRLPADRPARNGIDSLAILAAGRYSLNFVIADAISRGVVRLARLVRGSILEPYARWSRRKIAIDRLRALDDRILADIGLLRGEIELAVDGALPPRGSVLQRRVERHALPAERWHELPRAA